MAKSEKLKIFISYSHKDVKYKKRFINSFKIIRIDA